MLAPFPVSGGTMAAQAGPNQRKDSVMRSKIAALVVAAATAALLLGGWSSYGNLGHRGDTTRIAGWAWDDAPPIG